MKTEFEQIMDKLAEIEKRISALETVHIINVTTSQPDCDHDYPSVWHGTVPPRCSKCGKPAPGFLSSY